MDATDTTENRPLRPASRTSQETEPGIASNRKFRARWLLESKPNREFLLKQSNIFWKKNGWIAKYPFLLIRIMCLKVIYSKLPEKDYIVYQNQFYSGHSKLVSNFVDKFHKYRGQIARLASNNRANISALEVGGGVGFQTSALLEEGFEYIISTDLSAERVSYAISNNNSDKIKYLIADVSTLPFEDNSFDAVVAVAVLHSLPNSIKRCAIFEIARVARRTIVIFEPIVMERSSPKRWVFSWAAHFLDESQYIRNFVCDPFDHILREEGFTLVSCHKGFMGVVETKTYQK